MAFYDKFPYTNFQELNLDEIIKEIVSLRKDLDIAIETSTLKYADPIQWDITTQYEANTIVLNNDLIAYLSTRPVPAGVALDNTDYWTEIGSFERFFDTFIDSIALNNGNSDILSENVDADNLVFANGILYMTTTDLMAGDALRPGTNCEQYTVNDFVHYLVNKEKTNLITYIDAQDDELRQMIEAAANDMIINVKEFGATGDGITDDLPAFNAALVEAYTNGGIIYIPQGTYMLSDTWKIGNGSAQQESTYNDISIVGAGCGNNRYIQPNSHYGRTVLRRGTSAQGPMITVSGPITNVQIADLQLDCNEVAAIGLNVVHACYSTFKNLSVIRHTDTAYFSTTVAGNPSIFGCGGNKYSMIQCDSGSNDTQTCMKLTGSLSSANTYALDTCRNVIERVEFNHGSQGYGVVLEFADNNIFIEGQIFCPSGTTGRSVYLERPAAYPNFPSENCFINMAVIGGVGGQAGQLNEYGSGGHWFMPYSRADGEPLPRMQNIHVLCYDGREYFGGMQVLKQGDYNVQALSSFNLGTSWAVVAQRNFNSYDTPISALMHASVEVTGNAQIRLVIDGNEVPGSYRYVAGATYGNLSTFATQYVGTGTHTIELQASTNDTGRVNGGYFEASAVL